MIRNYSTIFPKGNTEEKALGPVFSAKTDKFNLLFAKFTDIPFFPFYDSRVANIGTFAPDILVSKGFRHIAVILHARKSVWINHHANAHCVAPVQNRIKVEKGALIQRIPRYLFFRFSGFKSTYSAISKKLIVE